MPTPSHWKALEKIVKRLGTHSAQFAYYGSALGAIALASGANLPPELNFIMGGIGVNLFSSLIEKIVQGDDPNDDEIRAKAESAITQSDIANLLTKQDFLQGYGRLIQRLDAQKEVSTTILAELRDGFGKVATAEQVEELKRLILQLVQQSPQVLTRKTRIFISYARADDEPFVERLYHDLKDEFDVWWDRKKMPNRGLTFLQEIREAIDWADRLLLVAGPRAFKSEYVRDEWLYAYETYKGINIALRLGDYTNFPSQLSGFDAPDFRSDADYKERLVTLKRQLTELVAPIGVFHNVPSLPPHFLNRPDALDALLELVITDVDKPTLISAEKRTTAIEGMGGIGKSVLAAAFAHDRKVRFAFPDGIVWLTVGRDAKLYELYRAVGVALGDHLSNYPDETTAQQNAQKTIMGKKCLIILDDVWELSVGHVFRDLISGTVTRLLITTRNLQINDLLNANEYRLKLVDETQAVDYLRNWVGDDPDLETIAEKLGCLFLALKLAGALMKENSLSGAEYLSVFERVSDMKIADDNLEVSINLGMNAAFAQDEDRKLLYHTFGIFQEDVPVPQQVVLRLWSHLRPDIRPLDHLNTLTTLVNLGLVERDEQKIITLHDLLYNYAHEKLGDRYVQIHQALLNSYNLPMENPWHEIADDGYLYDNLIYHLEQAKLYEEIHVLFQNKGWANKRTLPKLLQDFDWAKKHTLENDTATQIRYAIFDETLHNRYPQMPIEIASQLVIRGCVSAELIVSAIQGMDGDTKKKVETYITVIKQLDVATTKERLALDALILAKSIGDSQDRASLVLELHSYLSKSNKQSNYNLLWQAAIEINEWEQRESLFETILPNLSDDQIDEMKNELFASKISPRRYVYIFEEIKTYLNPKVVDEIASFVLDKVIDTDSYERVYLLDYLMKHLPESIQKRAQKNIVPAYLECVIWEPNDFATDAKSSFETLVKWIPLEDLPILWERASKDVAKKDGGHSWRAEKVKLAIAKHWGTIDKHSYQHITGSNDVPAFVQSLDIDELGDSHHILWCEAKVKIIPSLPKDTQEKEWLAVCEIAIKATWPDGMNAELYGRKSKWLDEFVLSIPIHLVPKVWEKTLEAFEELILERKTEKHFWSSSFHPRYYVGALSSLANRISDKEIADYIQSVIFLWVKYHDYSDDWSIAIARMINRLDTVERERQWERLTKIALGEEGKKPYVHSGSDFLFHIVGSSNDESWQNEKIEYLLEFTRLNQSQFGHLSESLLYNFYVLPEKVKPLVWIEAAQNLEEGYYNGRIMYCLEMIYPKIIEDIPDAFDRINWDFSIWSSTISGGYPSGYKALNYLLQHAPHEFGLAAYQLIKSKGGKLILEVNIQLFEFMSEDEQKEILYQLADTWSAEHIKALTPLAVDTWMPKTIWMAWQYMHNFNPDREWPYCNWALTLAPHIPVEHASQAYVMAFQHLGWPLWGDTCTVLAARLPQDFADDEWRRLTGILESHTYKYNIKDIRSAMASSLSDKKLKEILNNYQKQTQTGYKQLTEYAFIDGSLFRYFRSMFLVARSNRIHELSDLPFENRFWEFVIKLHRKFKNLASWSASMYGSFLAFTFPIMLPLIRFLRPIDHVLCLSYPFYIAINLEKVFRPRYSLSRGDLDYEYFRSHTTLLTILYEFVNRKIDNGENVNKNSTKGVFYFALIMIPLFFLLFERKILFRFLMIVGVIIGIFLFPLVWLLRRIIAIGFIDYYMTNQFFENSLDAHLRLSNSKFAEERLNQWVKQRKSPDMLEYRPLLNKIGGGKLRKEVAKAYKDANTWWYNAITVVEKP